jgi:hypothetical protein
MPFIGCYNLLGMFFESRTPIALADHNQLAIVHSLIFEIIAFHKDVPVLSYCITVLFHSVEEATPSKSEEASQGPSPSI